MCRMYGRQDWIPRAEKPTRLMLKLPFKFDFSLSHSFNSLCLLLLSSESLLWYYGWCAYNQTPNSLAQWATHFKIQIYYFYTSTFALDSLLLYSSPSHTMKGNMKEKKLRHYGRSFAWYHLFHALKEIRNWELFRLMINDKVGTLLNIFKVW